MVDFLSPATRAALDRLAADDAATAPLERLRHIRSLPGHSVAEAGKRLDLTVQAVYLRISRGQLRSETVALDDGRKYKRVFLD